MSTCHVQLFACVLSSCVSARVLLCTRCRLERRGVDFKGLSMEEKIGMMISASYTTAKYLKASTCGDSSDMPDTRFSPKA
eukprot:6380359-Amphidinium_carterae.1